MDVRINEFNLGARSDKNSPSIFFGLKIVNQQETETELLEPIPLGATAAAIVSAALGCLTISTTYRVITQSQVLSGKTIKTAVWPPYPSLVGSYPIHQLAGFSVWLGTWLMLYLAWRQHDLSLKSTIAVFFGLLFLATAMAWTPIGQPIGIAIAQALTTR